MTAVDRVIAALDAAGCAPKRLGGEWAAKCPAHDDKRASLSIGEGQDGRALVHCQANCELVHVLTALKLTMRDLFPDDKPAPSKPRIVATYDYRRADGTLHSQVVRFDPKDFRQRRPDGKGGWLWNRQGLEPIPFALPEIAAAASDALIVAVEGEKDAVNGAKAGLLCTTNAGGCGNSAAWSVPSFREPFRGRDIAIIPDNDQAGEKHAATVATALERIAATVKIVRLPGLSAKGDLSDWLAAGHTIDELRALVAAAPEWTAPAAPEAVTADVIMPHGGRRPARAFAMTETGAGELYADRFRGEVAYVTGVGWLTWAKTHWRRDPDKIAVMERTKIVSRAFLDEAKWATENDDARAKSFAHFGIAAQRVSFRRAVLDAAKSEPGIERDAADLDRDPMLLNAHNGTIDLVTGKLRAHNSGDLHTRVIPVDHDPDATCPRFEQFLIEVLPDADTIAFLQRFVGYCLTSSVEEEVFVFCYGEGANGKTKLAETIKAMLGPYAITGPKGLLMSRHGDHHECEMMPLMGARLATFSELPPNQRFDSRALKSLTGGDEISARWICANPVTFRPSHKILILANRKPDLDESDEAMRRRVRLVPFERVIPEDQRDPHLAQKLRAELPGILAWAVRGCLAWQSDRLGQPAKVRAASDAYVLECDRVAPFFAEVVTAGPALRVSCAALRGAYERWCEREHEHPVGTREFAQRVRQLGATSSSIRLGGAPVRGWLGVGLVDHGPHVDITEPLEKQGRDMCRPDLPKGGHTEPLVRNDRQMTSTDVYTSTEPDAPDPMAQLAHCLRVRPGTTATDADRHTLAEHFAGLNGSAEAAAQRLWNYWQSTTAPTVAGFLAKEPRRKELH